MCFDIQPSDVICFFEEDRELDVAGEECLAPSLETEMGGFGCFYRSIELARDPSISTSPQPSGKKEANPNRRFPYTSKSYTYCTIFIRQT